MRVVDEMGQSAETTVNIITYEETAEPYQIPAPKNVTATYANNEISLEWIHNWPYMARYILVRIGGVDLDFVPVTELAAVVDGVENASGVLEVAWLDEDYMVGEWAMLDVVDDSPPEGINIDPVQTGITMPD